MLRCVLLNLLTIIQIISLKNPNQKKSRRSRRKSSNTVKPNSDETKDDKVIEDAEVLNEETPAVEENSSRRGKLQP